MVTKTECNTKYRNGIYLIFAKERRRELQACTDFSSDLSFFCYSQRERERERESFSLILIRNLGPSLGSPLSFLSFVHRERERESSTCASIAAGLVASCCLSTFRSSECW